MQFLLRTGGAGDEKALSLIGQATILETYAGLAEGADLYAYLTQEFNADRVASTLREDRVQTWFVEIIPGNCVVGYALVLSHDDGSAFSTSELQRLYVLYRFHGLGLGGMLMDAVLEHARENDTERLTLRVNSQNKHAIDFYRRHGFTVVSEEPFRAGERDYGVLVMQRNLHENEAE